MDNNVEHIAVAWADTKIIELKRIPLVVPPTPPHLSPGVEYLTDSPFGGVKSIEETDPNPMDGTAPTAQVFKVPLRNVSASWPSEDNPGGGSNFKVPSITESRYPTAPGESTWEVVTFDNSDVTSWPPNPYDEDAPTHKVTLDILDSEELSTDLWLLCTGNSNYPGTAQWYLNRVSSGINMTETDRQERFDLMGVPTFYGHTLVGTTEYYEAPLRKCYEVELYIDIADNYYVESAGHWVAWSIEAYDVRPLFASKVAQSEAPFFVKFRECLGSNPNLMTVYSKVMAQYSGYDGAGASLIFYIDDVMPVIPDGAAAVFFEEDNYKGKSFVVDYSGGTGNDLRRDITLQEAGLSAFRSAVFPPPSTRYAEFSMGFYNAAYTDGEYLVSFGINRVDVNNYESATYTENEPNIRYELDGVSVAMDFICVHYQKF